MLNQIIELVADELNLDPKSLNKDTRLQEDLNVDSLDVVELVMKLEEEFSIEVSDEEAAGLKTIEDILNFVEKSK